MIGAEFDSEEVTSIYESTRDAPALKHSIQVHTWEIKVQSYWTHLRVIGQLKAFDQPISSISV